MAIYAEITKVGEDLSRARYGFSDGVEAARFAILDKTDGSVRAEDGLENIVYWAVARKISTAWARGGTAPERLMVAS
ncbi:hypothetical protein ABZX93_22950 [Streptomyces sp. NPDC006632]|uniref:hypothetical protein n=1 Tax=unclassified Streptomyces TaxID=2593676 RepID=UPI002E24E437